MIRKVTVYCCEIFRCSAAVSAAESVFRSLFIFLSRNSVQFHNPTLFPLPHPLPQLRAAGNPHAVSTNLPSLSGPCKPSLTVDVPRFIHVVACVSISFLKTKRIPLYAYVSDYWSAVHLDYFKLSVIANRFWWRCSESFRVPVFRSSDSVPRSGVSGPFGDATFF